MSDGELGDFEEYGDDPDASEDSPDSEEPELVERDDEEKIQRLQSEMVEARAEAERIRPLDEENPLDLDPRVGVKDIAFDRAKPGAKVYVVASLASSVGEYEEAFPDAPHLDEYAGNVVTRFSRSDAVLACVYVKDSLTKVDTNITAYPMPESRLTRFPAEEASLVGESSVEFARTHVPGTPPGANVATGVAPDGENTGDDETDEEDA